MRYKRKIAYFLYSQIRAIYKYSFLPISQKVKVLELKVVLSADINMDIPVILSPKLALYDLQNSSYDMHGNCARRQKRAWPSGIVNSDTNTVCP